MRARFLALLAAAAPSVVVGGACGGARAPVVSPLLVSAAPTAGAPANGDTASATASAAAAAAVVTERTTIVVQGHLPVPDRCTRLRGSYTLVEQRLTVQLERYRAGSAELAAGAARECGPAAAPLAFGTRVGPLAAGRYVVRVVADSAVLVAEQEVVIR